MALVEDHDVIQALAANRADHALDVRVLPGGSRRRDDLLDPYRFDRIAEVGAIRCIAIAQQIERSSVPRKGFGYVAREPKKAVGCSVTAVRTIFLRSWARMIIT
jgi:hypothetical protein